LIDLILILIPAICNQIQGQFARSSSARLLLCRRRRSPMAVRAVALLALALGSCPAAAQASPECTDLEQHTNCASRAPRSHHCLACAAASTMRPALAAANS
jgi:hypothetical protein